MPARLPTACAQPGCPNLTRQRFCNEHRREASKQADKHRSNANQRGYTSRWARARRLFLLRPENAACAVCGLPATCVDHVVPHKGNSRIFWDERNWQALCAHCHAVKTAREDGGYGRRVQEASAAGYPRCDELAYGP